MDTTVIIAVAVLALGAIGAFVMLRGRRKAPAPPAFSASSDDRTMVGLGIGPRRSDATVVDMHAAAPGAAPARSDATMVGAAPTPSARSDVTIVGTAPAAAPVAQAPAGTPSPAEAPTAVVSARRQDATAPTLKIPRTTGRLTITRGGSGTFAIEDREYVIGRSSRADIVVADPSVSGQHARLTVTPAGATVTDLGSSNGTTVNGTRVQGSQTVRSGDLIGVGEAVLRFDVS